LNPEPANLYNINTHIIIRKYSVYLIEFVCFFAMDEYMRGAAWYRPLNLSFWVVRSEPPFVFCRSARSISKYRKVYEPSHPNPENRK
jgi:hypothetical protein